MKNTRKMAALLAGTSSLALLLATSAFAEERHHDGTWRDSNRESNVQRDTRDDQSRDHDGARNGSARNDGNRDNAARDNAARDDAARNDAYRSNGSRDNGVRNDGYRNNGSRNDGHRNDGYRNGGYRNDRNDGYRNDGYRNDGNRNDRYRGAGRISEEGHIRSFTRERDGYRVYLDRGNYSYWVPSSHFRGRGPSIGLSIRLGGILNGGVVIVDDFGYDDAYYGGGGYRDGYNNGYNDGYVRGIVDRVDRRADIAVVRDDATGRYITVDLRSVNYRGSRLDSNDLRIGDRVSFSGSFLRGGVFTAYRIDAIGAY